MLARRLPGILPPLDDEAALEVASLRSLAGETVVALDRTPPFEAPHHSASIAALVGGGSRTARPGAIARASRGVLFVDEAAEAPAGVLDALRQPLEQGRIEIHRAGFRTEFPARFQLVLATNPCPCGEYGVRGGTCVCAPSVVRRYLAKLSGPLLDRMDIDLRLQRVASSRMDESPSVSTAQARERVAAARERAARRLCGTPWRLNADVPGAWLRQGPRPVAREARRAVEAALQRGAITLRGYDRILRVRKSEFSRFSSLARAEETMTEKLSGFERCGVCLAMVESPRLTVRRSVLSDTEHPAWESGAGMAPNLCRRARRPTGVSPCGRAAKGCRRSVGDENATRMRSSQTRGNSSRCAREERLTEQPIDAEQVALH